MILLASIPASADPKKVQAELTGSVFFHDDTIGQESIRIYSLGLRGEYELDGLFDVPETLRIAPGLTWQHLFAREREGTNAASVGSALHVFTFPLQVGWRFPSGSRLLSPYLTGGPSVSWTQVLYRVADPVAGRSTDTTISGPAWGITYGAGLLLAWLEEEKPLGISGRLEMIRLHRGPLTNLALSAGVGLFF